MKPRDPIAQLPTHEVANTPPYMGDQDLWQDDHALRHWINVHGGKGHSEHLAHVGRLTGLNDTFEKADQANRQGPELRAYDRYGCLLYTSPSPRDGLLSRMPSSA